MIYLVYCEDQDSSSGVSFSGIFAFKMDAERWAESEGPEYKVVETKFGPIDWMKIVTLPDWNEL